MRDLHASRFVAGIPLYQQVRDKIQELVEIDQQAKDIPLTDAYLAERFGVSRITVRKAVEGLVESGLLYRVPKLGTFVRPGMFREKLTLTSFLDPWSEGSGRLKIRIGAFSHLKANSDIAHRLHIKPGAEVAYIQRLRFQGTKLVIIDDRYMRKQHASQLTDKDLLTSSIVDYFQNRAKIPIENGEMEIAARGANSKEASAFGIKIGQPVLVRNVTLFGRRRQPLVTGVSIYRADCVSYRVMLSK